MILITGSSGNVGQEVLRQIAKSGRPVRAAFQSVSKASSAPPGVEIAIMDYNQPIGAVAVRVLTEDNHVGRIYTLTGPEALSNSRLAEILSANLGREIKYVDLQPAQMKQALLAAGSPE
jgi:uncharacterized protein YbjT (DUF2867 family)